MNLDLLIGKYTCAKGGRLFLCFADLSSAFNLVDYSIRWPALLTLGAPRQIICFSAGLYENLSSKVRFGSRGECTRNFYVKRGIRQGCVLAPLLFSLFINGVYKALQAVQADAPRLPGSPIPVLLYADDAV